MCTGIFYILCYGNVGAHVCGLYIYFIVEVAIPWSGCKSMVSTLLMTSCGIISVWNWHVMKSSLAVCFVAGNLSLCGACLLCEYVYTRCCCTRTCLRLAEAHSPRFMISGAGMIWVGPDVLLCLWVC